MGNTRFFCAPVEIRSGEIRIGKYNKALISNVNIFRIFKETGESIREFLRMRQYMVKIENIAFQGNLMREMGAEGSYFHYQFGNLNLEQKKFLHLRMDKTGFDSPWKRKFARIPVSAFENSLEVPLGINFPRFAGKAGGIIRNFSVLGLFVELNTITPSMEEKIGHVFKFRMVTTKGKILDGFRGEIIRIYDQVPVPRKIRRGLGIRFLDCDAQSQLRYYQLIKGVCLKVKEQQRLEPIA